MATIISLPNGKFKAQVRFKGISKSMTFFTKEEARIWAFELEKLILTKLDNQTYITFSELADRYLKEITPKKQGKRSEFYRIRRLLNSDSPFLKKYVHEIRRQDIQQWQEKRLQEISSGSVIREQATISAILTQGVIWEYLPNNPAKYVEKIKKPAARTRRYSEAEINALVYVSGFSLESRNETQLARMGGAFLFAIETAMRAGEIYNLTWENVDLIRRTVFLPRTKNGHPRTVPLSSKAVAILKNMQILQLSEKDSVFQISSNSNMDRLFRKMKARANLAQSDLRFHDTRREALTRLATKFNSMELAKISGHRDISILQNTYYAPDISEFASRLD